MWFLVLCVLGCVLYMLFANKGDSRVFLTINGVLTRELKHFMVIKATFNKLYKTT